MQIVIQALKLACGISMVIKSILSDWPIENPRWQPFSKIATKKYILLHEVEPNWPNSSIFCQNHCFEDAEVSSECSITHLYKDNACDITR